MTTTQPNLEKIHAAIPHRAPMLLVDEIVTQSENTICCRKTFHPEEYFFQGHYPGHPLTPGVILCEATVQSGAILLADIVSTGNAIPVLTRMNDVKFKKMVHPGDTIEMHVTLDDVVSSAYYMTGVVKCEGKTAARLSFVCSVADPAAG
jgi:3-hydroxyacyl-[acyl-carrier-protein] dehydratase